MIEPEVVDLRQFAEEIDFLPKISQSDFNTAMASSKWKDRKEALDALFELVKNADNQRIKDQNGPDMDNIVKSLAIRVKSDANVMVVSLASNIIGLLSRGIGDSFGRYRTTLVAPMLERMKERKPSVVDAIGAGLDDFFKTVRPHVSNRLL